MTATYYDLESLRAAIRDGAKPEYLFFWGHTPKHGILGKECLSQWYPAPFEVDGCLFPTAEHYMMVHKALLFDDRETAERMLRAPDPRAVKTVGRSVKGFNEEIWDANRFTIVVNGNHAKFSQNTSLRAFLVATRTRILVEASPQDRIWGIGLAADSEAATNPFAWRGLNLLGFALMVVRDRLAGATAARRRHGADDHRNRDD
jgi:ribA/ribD-fused uncharacterized protein